MKRVKLIALCALAPTLIKAQKIESSIIDKITGDTIITSSSEKIYSKASFSGTVGEQLRLRIIKDNRSLFLAFSIQTGKTEAFIIPDNAKIHIKLSSGVVITLQNVKTVLSKFSLISFGSTRSVVYNITDFDFKKLKEAKITFIRIETDDSPFEYDITENSAKKASALCYLY